MKRLYVNTNRHCLSSDRIQLITKPILVLLALPEYYDSAISRVSSGKDTKVKKSRLSLLLKQHLGAVRALPALLTTSHSPMPYSSAPGLNRCFSEMLGLQTHGLQCIWNLLAAHKPHNMRVQPFKGPVPSAVLLRPLVVILAQMTTQSPFALSKGHPSSLLYGFNVGWGEYKGKKKKEVGSQYFHKSLFFPVSFPSFNLSFHVALFFFLSLCQSSGAEC